MHIFCQLIALVSVIIGLVAIIEYMNIKSQNSSSNFNSLHSWIGLIAIIIYLYNICFALTREWFQRSEWMTRYYPTLMIRLLPYHKCLGYATLICTVCAIVTGISHQQYGCTTNPSISYQQLPEGCKISYGVGITSVISIIFIILAIIFRKQNIVIMNIHPKADTIIENKDFQSSHRKRLNQYNNEIENKNEVSQNLQNSAIKSYDDYDYENEEEWKCLTDTHRSIRNIEDAITQQNIKRFENSDEIGLIPHPSPRYIGHQDAYRM